MKPNESQFTSLVADVKELQEKLKNSPTGMLSDPDDIRKLIIRNLREIRQSKEIGQKNDEPKPVMSQMQSNPVSQDHAPKGINLEDNEGAKKDDNKRNALK